MSSRSRRMPLVGVLAFLLLASVAPLRAAGGTETEAGDGDYSAEIRRTSYGIPHVKGDSLGDAAFGAGYAFAEDNLCVMADTFATVNAQRARFFGPDASYRSEANGVVANNLRSDFFYQRVNDSGVIEQLVSGTHESGFPGPSAEVREAVQGWAAGYNAYLGDTGVDNLPDPGCRGKEWVRPITEQDMFRRFYQLSLFASQGALLNYIVAASPPTPSAPLKGPEVPKGFELPDDFPSPDNLQVGSNAYGLGGDATDTGRGMVLGNPHFPWQGPERLYWMHLTVPGELNVTGAALFGSPAVLIGHNEHLAWSHTVSVPYRFTGYELKLVPGKPTSYFYDGEIRDMEETEVTVLSRSEEGILEERSHTFYDSHYGPMIHFEGALMPWTPVVGYTIKDANADNLRTLDHFLATNKASSVRELHDILAEFQAIPWVNTIAADSSGEALYADMSVVPHVTDQQIDACTTSPVSKALLQLARLPVLDGSRSQCETGSDPDSVVPGIYGAEALPKMFRNDYVENSNDSYWLSNAREPMPRHPYVMGAYETERSPRTRLGLLMIEQRLDGSDGREGDRFTLDQVQETVFNNRHLVGELVRDELVAECEEGPTVLMKDGTTVDISEACPVFAAWDLKVDLESSGAPLFREFMRFAYGSSLGFWQNGFDKSRPVETPNGLNRNNPEIRQAIGEAVRRLEGFDIPLDAKLGDVQFETRNGEKIPMHGGSEAGIFNYLLAPWDNSTGGYPDTTYGASFVMAAGFTDDGPESRAILTYSQSTNPASPHFSDMTHLYSRKEWVDMRFSEESIAADPNLRTYVVGRTEPEPAPSPSGPGQGKGKGTGPKVPPGPPPGKGPRP